MEEEDLTIGVFLSFGLMEYSLEECKKLSYADKYPEEIKEFEKISKKIYKFFEKIEKKTKSIELFDADIEFNLKDRKTEVSRS